MSAREKCPKCSATWPVVQGGVCPVCTAGSISKLAERPINYTLYTAIRAAHLNSVEVVTTLTVQDDAPLVSDQHAPPNPGSVETCCALEHARQAQPDPYTGRLDRAGIDQPRGSPGQEGQRAQGRVEPTSEAEWLLANIESAVDSAQREALQCVPGGYQAGMLYTIRKIRASLKALAASMHHNQFATDAGREALAPGPLGSTDQPAKDSLTIRAGEQNTTDLTDHQTTNSGRE